MLRYTSAAAALLDPSLFSLPFEENGTQAASSSERCSAHRLQMLAFKAMKIIPANFIIDTARVRGELRAGGTVVETSSGNFALGMAMICNLLKHPFVAIGDPAIEPAYKRQLEMLGGRVEIITDKKGSQGYQKARLERLHEILDTDRGSFWCRQYDNEDNARAYTSVGQALASAVGPRAVLVAPVGSGGSSCGIATALRASGTDCTLVGVDTFNSILFGQTDGPRQLRGLGNTVMPKNLRHELFDEVHWVSAALADHFTRKLYRSTGHFRGATTGAAWAVARDLQQRYPDTPVVFLSPDDGSRYLDSTYLEPVPSADRTLGHLAAHAGSTFDVLTPEQIDLPNAFSAGSDWSRMVWNRMNIHQVR